MRRKSVYELEVGAQVGDFAQNAPTDRASGDPGVDFLVVVQRDSARVAPTADVTAVLTCGQGTCVLEQGPIIQVWPSGQITLIGDVIGSRGGIMGYEAAMVFRGPAIKLL